MMPIKTQTENWLRKISTSIAALIYNRVLASFELVQYQNFTTLGTGGQ